MFFSSFSLEWRGRLLRSWLHATAGCLPPRLPLVVAADAVAVMAAAVGSCLAVVVAVAVVSGRERGAGPAAELGAV